MLRIVIFFLGCMVSIADESPKPIELGSPLPDFSLPGIDGKTYSQKDFAKTKVLAIIFTCNHCPTAQAYEERIKQLHEQYKDKDVALIAVTPNDPKALRPDELGYTESGDTLEETKIRAKERGFTFPYLYDGETQAFSRKLGCLATPHVFIFDKDRKLRYLGAIDDSADPAKVKTRHAQETIDALLADKPVPVEKTRPSGCSTKWSEKRESVQKAIAQSDALPVELTPIDLDGLKNLAKNDTKQLLLVNFWASTCQPCVNEMPELLFIHRAYSKRDFKLVTVSVDPIDKKEHILNVLKEQKMACTNYISAEQNPDKLADAIDSKWEGPVPYTMLIAPGGNVIYRKLGEIDPVELRKAILNKLGRGR